MKYRKKPVVIEAVQWNGNNFKEVHLFVGDILKYNISAKDGKIVNMKIKTLEGDMKVCIEDYIIKGVNGEFYPCKPYIFEKTYEEILELGE